ncbi:hypothetical protein [Paenibacillus sp. UNC451MF]|uniref:hypothetical protein n=1 Tax=Paenibacillus sp. UNC451MF TaxID=1449063 RepID=UPI00048CEE30|nr:hypothetical protein [Paenibacillus sp. UNC451MF]
MKPIHKYGLCMELPDGKVPGFYAQLIKALAAKAPLFDRDKELLIFSEPNEREAAYGIMAQYKIPYEELDILLLPESVQIEPTFDDYGFVSRSEQTYVYKDKVSMYTLIADDVSAEPALALLQMEEHLLARYRDNDNTIYITDLHSDELMARIARAYQCSVHFLPLG